MLLEAIHDAMTPNSIREKALKKHRVEIGISVYSGLL